MALQDPVAAYDAATNVEAQLVKILLVEAGIDAFASEDLSTGGLWMFGTLPGIHKPQVWVSAQDLERAKRILQSYEAQEAERNREPQSTDPIAALPVDVLCEECDKPSIFPAAQRGTLQECPHCGAYVDVGEGDSSWREGDESSET